jgi:regulator of RNase E activity RraB
MNADVKKKWVAALRSGEYTQGRDCLYNADNGKFCCLGVLCDIAVNENVIDCDGTMDDEFIGVLYTFDAEAYELPYQVQEWAGLESSNPCVVYNKDILSIATLNDDKRHTFNELADIIEAQL